MIKLSNLFFLAIFIFKIPNFYIILNNPFTTTHVLARFILIFCFLKILLVKKKFSNYFIIIRNLLFFALIIQTVFIINVVNIYSYLERYEDILVGIAAFYTFYYFKNEWNKILRILVFSAFINVIFQLIIFFFSENNQNNFLVNLLPIYEKQYILLLKNLNRGRIYLDSFDEILIPILLLKKRKQFKLEIITRIFLCIIVSFVSWISLVRSKFLMVFLGVIFSWQIARNHVIKFIIIFLLIILITSSFFLKTFIDFSKRSIIDRFLLENYQEDVISIKNRIKQIFDSFQIVQYSIFGVGPGNYYDYVSSSKTSILLKRLIKNNNYEGFATGIEFPHNLFALWLSEIGYLGLVTLIFIIIFIAKKDFQELRLGCSYKKKALIGSFWILFSFSLFNPPTSGTFNLLFFGLRGLIAGK